jgi:hypothetical protein
MYSQTCIQLIAYLRLINSNIQFQSAMIHILLLPTERTERQRVKHDVIYIIIIILQTSILIIGYLFGFRV